MILYVLAQAKLARLWGQHCKESLRHILETIQQLITLRVISTNYSRNFQVQDDDSVTMATKLMKVSFLFLIMLKILNSIIRIKTSDCINLQIFYMF